MCQWDLFCWRQASPASHGESPSREPSGAPPIFQKENVQQYPGTCLQTRTREGIQASVEVPPLLLLLHLLQPRQPSTHPPPSRHLASPPPRPNPRQRLPQKTAGCLSTQTTWRNSWLQERMWREGKRSQACPTYRTQTIPPLTSPAQPPPALTTRGRKAPQRGICGGMRGDTEGSRRVLTQDER